MSPLTHALAGDWHGFFRQLGGEAWLGVPLVPKAIRAFGRAEVAEAAGVASAERPPVVPEAAPVGAPPAAPASTVRWVGGVPSEEGLRLVDSARRSLQVPTSRNIVFAESVIEGRPRQLVTGVSGGASPPGTVPAPTNRLFQTRNIRGAAPTDNHSEVKILEDIARDLPTNARGTINLFTERHLVDRVRE